MRSAIVLDNLLRNAIAHSPDRTRSSTIAIGPGARISVDDRGPGLPPDSCGGSSSRSRAASTARPIATPAPASDSACAICKRIVDGSPRRDRDRGSRGRRRALHHHVLTETRTGPSTTWSSGRARAGRCLRAGVERDAAARVGRRSRSRRPTHRSTSRKAIRSSSLPGSPSVEAEVRVAGVRVELPRAVREQIGQRRRLAVVQVRRAEREAVERRHVVAGAALRRGRALPRRAQSRARRSRRSSPGMPNVPTLRSTHAICAIGDRARPPRDRSRPRAIAGCAETALRGSR